MIILRKVLTLRPCSIEKDSAKNDPPMETKTTSHQVTFVSFAVPFTFVLLAGVFGSAEVEESAVTSFSAGAGFSFGGSVGRGMGSGSVFGVPVFDVLQGVGDRLPFQGAWGQSVSWPLRFFVGWEHYYLFRTWFYGFAALFVCLRVVQSWLPRLTAWGLALFGVLVNSSFGLYVRQNEWSDHYVQTIGVCAVSMFLMHRDFVDGVPGSRFDLSRWMLLCLWVSVDGVLTGHPGFWPIALFVWLSVGVVFGGSRAFCGRLVEWARGRLVSLVIVVAAAAVTVAVVVTDLLAEMKGETFGASRLARTQGLFSEFAFGGLYGLSSGGVLPESVRRVVASVLASALMPLFVLFDGWLPQMFRASNFPELVRVEYTGLLVLVPLVLGWRRLADRRVRSVAGRVVAAQALMWVFVVASTRDLLPTGLAPSGAWLALPVVLVLNVFLSFLLVGNLPARVVSVRGLAVANILLVGVWCAFQLGFVSFGSVPHLPERYPSRFRVADEIARSDWYRAAETRPGRVVLANANFYNFLSFVSLSVPVVAPAQPKIRSSGHLQPNYALNYAVDPLELRQEADWGRLEPVMEFLHVEQILVGDSGSSWYPDEFSTRETVTLDIPEFEGFAHQPSRSYRVIRRESFPAIVIGERAARRVKECPVLIEKCPVVSDSRRLDPSATPRLRTCDAVCLWTYHAPPVRGSDVLILPLTYDQSLAVRDAAGSRLETSNVGGFLGVIGENGLDEGMLTVTLSPDARMLSRVGVSYLNLGVFLFLLGCAASPWVKSRRRKLRVE